MNLVLGHARSHTDQPPEIHDGGKHDPIDRELLNLVQQRFALGRIPLLRLLEKQCVDIIVAARRIGTFGVNKRLHARCRIARGPGSGDKQALEFFLLPGRVKGRSLHVAHLDPNADRIEVVDHGFTHDKKGWDRHQFPRVKTVGITRLG